MHCLLQNFTVTQEAEEDGGIETNSLHANLVDFDVASRPDEDRGGISVQVNGAVRLYGETERFYQLSQDIEVHRFTRLSFMYTDPNPQTERACVSTRDSTRLCRIVVHRVVSFPKGGRM